MASPLVSADPQTFDGYCLRCRHARTVTDAVEREVWNGKRVRRSLRGSCPQCGATVSRFIRNRPS